MTTTAQDGPLLSERRGPWVQLASGLAFDLLDPTVEQARAAVDDLITAICRINRFAGHTGGGDVWSVGAHSLLVADLLEIWGAPLALQREGLLHDLPEGIYGDITQPVAVAIRLLCEDQGLPINPLVELRQRIDRVVREAVGLPEDEHPLVKRADLVALAIERRDLMKPCEREWALPEFAPVTPIVKHERYGWRHQEVRQTFTKRLELLGGSLSS